MLTWNSGLAFAVLCPESEAPEDLRNSRWENVWGNRPNLSYLNYYLCLDQLDGLTLHTYNFFALGIVHSWKSRGEICSRAFPARSQLMGGTGEASPECGPSVSALVGGGQAALGGPLPIFPVLLAARAGINWLKIGKWKGGSSILSFFFESSY